MTMLDGVMTGSKTNNQAGAILYSQTAEEARISNIYKMLSRIASGRQWQAVPGEAQPVNICKSGSQKAREKFRTQ